MAHGLLYNTLGYTGEIRMVTLVQSLTLLFVVFSLFLIILIPVTFATSGQGGTSNGTIVGLGALWASLLFATGIASSFV